MNHPSLISSAFRQSFGSEPLVVRSPGRINLIGEHTDYNMGFVLPAAIDKAMYIAIGPRIDNRCDIISNDLRDRYECDLKNVQPMQSAWSNYVLGVVDQLKKAGHAVGGFNCVFGGDIPIGAGLSSSAAIEAGMAVALNALFGLDLPLLALAELAQRAENEFVGVKCGIMDPFINLFGEQNTLFRLDCRSMHFEPIRFGGQASIVLFDTRISRSLGTAEYNRRREECQAGVDVLRRRYPRVTHVRDMTQEMLDLHRNELDPTVYRRCRYVIAEIARVDLVCSMVKRDALAETGEQLYRSHEGLRSDYEVSCAELDYLVETASTVPGVFGARMMGGGFGGCTINLVAPDAVDHVCEEVQRRYEERFHVAPQSYVTSIGQGTRVLTGRIYERV